MTPDDSENERDKAPDSSKFCNPDIIPNEPAW